MVGSQRRMDSQPSAELERKLEQLPMLPVVVSEILGLNPDHEEYFDRLVELAERDPPFAVRVLRCANSVFSAPATPIVSLPQAIMRLGTQQCASLVLALAVVKVFVPHSEAQRFLWIHSLQTALFARMFCRTLPRLRRSADQAYACGLLHDIGRFVQFEGAPIDLKRIDETHWASPRELVEVERSQLGYDHALLGWHACQKWSLPEMIGEVVRRHHEALPAQYEDPPELVRITQWADTLSMALTLDHGTAAASPETLGDWLAERYPGIGPQEPNAGSRAWQQAVPEVLAQSHELAQHLHLV